MRCLLGDELYEFVYDKAGDYSLEFIDNDYPAGHEQCVINFVSVVVECFAKAGELKKKAIDFHGLSGRSERFVGGCVASSPTVLL